MNMKVYLHGVATVFVAALSGCVTIHTESVTRSPGDSQAQSNKDFAVEFYQRVLLDRDVDAADHYLATGYIQHNPIQNTLHLVYESRQYHVSPILSKEGVYEYAGMLVMYWAMIREWMCSVPS